MSESKRPALLSLEETAVRLAALPGWTERDKSLIRAVAFPSYADALAFVNRVAGDAERADHHPWLILEQRRVTIGFSTHSAGGVTQLDVDAAARAEALIAHA